MVELTYRQLINLAIGSPEPGHVNFYALRCLLLSFADKLNITEEPVDCTKYGIIQMIVSSAQCGSDTQLGKKLEKVTKKYTRKRMLGGAEEPNEEDEPVVEPVLDPLDMADQGELNVPETTLEPEEVLEQDSKLEPRGPLIAAHSDVGDAETLAAPSGIGISLSDSGVDRSNIDVTPSVNEIAHADITVVRSSISATPSASAAVAADSRNTQEAPLESSKSAGFRTSSQPQSIAYPSSGDLIISRIDASMQYETNADVTVRRYSAPATVGDLDKAVSIMKDQLELAMEELFTISEIVTGNKSFSKMEQLRLLSNKLRSIQRENVFVEGMHGYKLDEELATSWPEIRNEMEEEAIERRSQFSAQAGVIDQYNLELHMCYSPEKLLNQLLQLKADFCMLTNKVNEITATILEQDFTSTKALLREQQGEMRDVKYNSTRLAEMLEHAETKQLSMNEAIRQINKILDEVKQTKSDKDEIEILLADKVDYKQLQRKVSHEQLLDLKCIMEKELCEIRNSINANEKNSTQLMENMLSKLGGSESVDVVLKNFKEKIDLEIQRLQEKLQKFIESTGDECAAGGRIKVLQDLACLSCDTTCAMKTIEKSKVSKMPNAHASNLLSPLITYELSSIRKSGIMGYYRKDDFPHSPSAWMNRQNVAMRTCVPRHAGGAHTTSTAKERVEKVLLQKK